MDENVVWMPTSPESSNLAGFARTVGVSVGELQQWSIDNSPEFWAAVWDSYVIGDRGSRLIETSAEFAANRFLPDATLNVAENLLRHTGEDLAIVFRCEIDSLSRDVTYSQLRTMVAKAQAALVELGVVPGDRVAAWMPNLVETYVTMLAATSIGAVFTSTSPDFGVQGVLDRFEQVSPKVIVAADGYTYGGQTHDRLSALNEVVEALDSLVGVIVVPFCGSGDLAVVPSAVSWTDAVDARHESEPSFVRLPFDHPWYVLYSSGTTGKPKCIVHRSGGVLLKHLSEHILHNDVRPHDREFYFTTAGWMMWNWLASGLATGAAIVVYDGSPFHPDGNRLFDLADEVGVTLFGMSAKFIESIDKAGLRPRDTHGLSTVRSIASTGSPLVAEGFRYIYDAVAPEAHLASISGGTDLCGCLVIGDPTRPVLAGEIQGQALGLDTQVVDGDGQPTGSGERGELVCRNPFPSMPLEFWGDDDGSRYRSAYFERFPGMWHQGDYAERTESGGFVIHGRSDATLNPGGVRIGTAEIYRIVDRFDEVLESIVIGQRQGGDVRVVLFVRLRDEVTLDDDLRDRIRRAVRSGATPRHMPSVVAQVADIPRTRSGKMVELAVRAVVHGEEVKNIEALANPEALDYFANHPDVI